MKQVELKNYVKNLLKRYLTKHYEGERVSLNNLVNLSSDNRRLAELAQSYYLLHDKYEHSKKFETFTGEVFEDKDEYLQSRSKYVWQYSDLIKSKDATKEDFRQKMLDLLKDKNISMYRVSKDCKVNQSNLSAFLKKGELNKLSVKKVLELHGMLSRA